MKQGMKCAALLLAAAVAAAPCGCAAERDTAAALCESEAAWLLSAQTADGALLYYPEENGAAFINPYFADYTAMALLEAGYADAAARYIEWHFDHLNRSPDRCGIAFTICDFDVAMEGGAAVRETPTGDYDSSDSYAATFLSLLARYYRATGDGALLAAHYDDVCGILGALAATSDGGLTAAKADYPVYYLMDNCEVYAGLADARTLFGEVYADGAVYPGADAVRADIEARLAALGAAIEERLWNEAEQHYECAQEADGSCSAFDWNELYMSACSQLFPILCGVLAPDSARARALYGTFCEKFDWTKIDFGADADAAYCWGCIVCAAAMMGDGARVDAYLGTYARTFARDHAYPLFGADCAWVLRAALWRANRAPG
ncbi:MAG: hypothetical protein VB021_05450 [Oscillospiraceae bacterium]|nr:hypothetical protein [Oscillospiraceae bacterium]